MTAPPAAGYPALTPQWAITVAQRAPVRRGERSPDRVPGPGEAVDAEQPDPHCDGGEQLRSVPGRGDRPHRAVETGRRVGVDGDAGPAEHRADEQEGHSLGDERDLAGPADQPA